MTTTTTNWRAALAALLATGGLLLGACGDGDSDKADKDGDGSSENDQSESEAEAETAADGPILDPDAPEADSEFCQGAIELMSMSTDSEAESTGDDPALDFAEALDPPDAIAAEWDKLMTTTREMQEVDYNDPAASERAMAAYQDTADEQTKVMTYLQDQCGINVGMPGDSADSEAPPTSGG